MPEKKKEGEKKANFFTPLMTEFRKKDIMQIIVGASLIAVFFGFSSEMRKLGESLPLANLIGLVIFSLSFISIFVYYHYHHQRNHAHHKREFFKRVLSTYFIPFIITSILLTLIQEAPWLTDFAVTLKRIIIVTLPSSMSAAITDSLH